MSHFCEVEILKVEMDDLFVDLFSVAFFAVKKNYFN